MAALYQVREAMTHGPSIMVAEDRAEPLAIPARSRRGKLMRRLWAAGAAIVLWLALVGLPTLAQEASPSTPGEASVTDVEQLDKRMVDLTIESPSVGEVKVRLLLPAGFAYEPDRTWPVLYLLHGATDDHSTWTEQTEVAEMTADLDLLVAMPDGGEWGWYSDWWNGGEGGSPAWETFHVTELRDILERDWRAGHQRMVAGTSMGGYGAMHYATAHPELFRAAASFSGVLDPVGAGDVPDPMLWGDREDQADVWAAHDTLGMAEALQGKALYVSWQDGQPGPLDPPDATSDWLEEWLAPQNEAFVARLEELGIPVTVEMGRGTHTWPYRDRSLRLALPLLLAALEA